MCIYAHHGTHIQLMGPPVTAAYFLALCGTKLNPRHRGPPSLVFYVVSPPPPILLLPTWSSKLPNAQVPLFSFTQLKQSSGQEKPACLYRQVPHLPLTYLSCFFFQTIYFSYMYLLVRVCTRVKTHVCMILQRTSEDSSESVPSFHHVALRPTSDASV